MRIYPITDALFAKYGRVVSGYDLTEAMEVLKSREQPLGGVKYVAEDAELQQLSLTEKLQENFFAGMPIQLGWCCGYNRMLNCLEYHRSSEVVFGTEGFILLLGLRSDIVDGKLDTDTIKAFLVPGGVLLELYATTLHYTPVDSVAGEGFRTGVALPRGTNLDREKTPGIDSEDVGLFAVNKWLLAHPDAPEVVNGAHIGLTGNNIRI